MEQVPSKITKSGDVVALQNIKGFIRMIVKTNGEYIETTLPDGFDSRIDSQDILESAFTSDVKNALIATASHLAEKIDASLPPPALIHTGRHNKRHLVSTPVQLTPNTFMGCYDANYEGVSPSLQYMLLTNNQAQFIDFHMANGLDSFFVHEEEFPISLPIDDKLAKSIRDISLDEFAFPHED